MLNSNNPPAANKASSKLNFVEAKAFGFKVNPIIAVINDDAIIIIMPRERPYAIKLLIKKKSSVNNLQGNDF